MENNEDVKLDSICPTCGWKGPEATLKDGVTVSEKYVQKHCPQCEYCFGTYAKEVK